MASSSQVSGQYDHDIEENTKDPSWYAPLYKAAFNGDWKAAREFFDNHPDAIVAPINKLLETALHVAAFSRQSNFVENLVELMPSEALAKQDTSGATAFYYSVVANNIKGVQAMVKKNPNLPMIRKNNDWSPVQSAAQLGHREMTWFLCSVTKDENPISFQGYDGVFTMNLAISSNLFDVALHLVHLHPEIATVKDGYGLSALDTLARTPTAFVSGNRLGFWQRCIYSWVNVKQDFSRYQSINGDAKDKGSTTYHSLSSTVSQLFKAFQGWYGLFWGFVNLLVPSIKQVHDMKLMHNQAYELAKFICDQLMLTNNHLTILNFLPILEAAKFGIVELIDIFIRTYPSIIWYYHEKTYETIIHVASVNRNEMVFNYIKSMGPCKDTLVTTYVDYASKSNILHLVAKIAPSDKLNSITGEALQMQREFQWFKEVEGIVQPNYRTAKNKDNLTPRDIFTKEHKELAQKGEKWMKDMASSSMVVATLITTVAFAAAFTVPGGNDSNGRPIFLKSKPFMVFVLSDSLALFSSATSVLMFLSILTSGFAEEDFLFSLPRKLITGLATLFFSILAMMGAFGATIFIMLGHEFQWVAILITCIICIPVTLFAMLQLPLFVEIVKSTYVSKFFH